ncbi:hypothetical protein GCM10009087_33630 [Sphingomonas oligophenolica]|uniref:Uncharacterized protein n=1 Tax=Sphingomonas oligophenolica TaxID=301154 RepID=A0ABU9XYN8_9SPHN
MKLILLAALAAATPVMAQETTPPTTTADPVGGYQPSHPAISGPVTPGVKPIYVQAPSPDQAYPAPPPLDHYPICKPGQFDKCLERNSPK